MGSYVPSTTAERADMLAQLGLTSEEDLFSVIPAGVRLKQLDLPEGLSELELRETMEAAAARNTRFSTLFRGAGAYRHYIPAMVKSVAANETFLTAYTPYQAEISQGVLQAIFEYQTMICQLTGMEVSNASVYDGATAAAEAIVMCQERRRSRAVVSGAVHPDVLAVITTYCASHQIPLTVLPADGGVTDPAALAQVLGEDAACVYIQTPNYYGLLEDADALVAAAHAAGAKAILGVNPIALGLLKTPGACGADIAVGEGQPLGLPLGFGGPYLGFMACTKALMRKLPGRIVGQTSDSRGDRAFVLTLQAREQHIRREKASASICSNEALCALTASVYLAAMGPQGIAQAAEQCLSKAHYAAQKITEVPGFRLVYGKPFFHEFVTTCPVPAETLNHALAEHGMLGPLPLEGNRLLWCVTEVVSKARIDEMAALLKEVCKV